jgi:Zn-dependent protease with chaperone function
MTEQEVEAFLAELAHREGRQPPVVRWVEDSFTGQAGRRHGRDMIMLGRRILADPEDARFTAAHEMGHVALGHTSGRRAGRVLVVYVGAALAVLAGTTVVVLLGMHAFPVAALGLVTWVVLQAVLLKRLKQPQESAADVYATSHGAPLTRRPALQYAARRTAAARLLALVFPIHPSWLERAAIVAPLIRSR